MRWMCLGNHHANCQAEMRTAVPPLLLPVRDVLYPSLPLWHGGRGFQGCFWDGVAQLEEQGVDTKHASDTDENVYL